MLKMIKTLHCELTGLRTLSKRLARVTAIAKRKLEKYKRYRQYLKDEPRRKERPDRKQVAEACRKWGEVERENVRLLKELAVQIDNNRDATGWVRRLEVSSCFRAINTFTELAGVLGELAEMLGA